MDVFTLRRPPLPASPPGHSGVNGPGEGGQGHSRGGLERVGAWCQVGGVGIFVENKQFCRSVLAIYL